MRRLAARYGEPPMSAPPDDTPIEPATPEYVAAVARAVLDVDYSEIHTTPVGQTVIGWIRASHDQILAVAQLVQIGQASATGPNIRTIMDVVLRLIWLNTLDDRSAGLRGQFQGEQRLNDLHPTNLTKMRLPIDIIETPPVIDLEQFGPLDTQLQGIAARVLDMTLDAAKRNQDLTGIPGFYDQWQTTSRFNHATRALAEAYAPRDTMGTFTTPTSPIDTSLHLNGVSMVICAIGTSILIDEGLPPTKASAFFRASLIAGI